MEAGIGLIIGERVKALRIATGKSLRQFSVDTGFNKTVISRIERGDHNMTLETILKLTRNLGTDPSELLRGIK